MTGDDDLGFVYIDALKCFESPGEWMINDVFELQGDESIKIKEGFSSWGNMYVQIRFLQEGKMDDSLPETKINLEAILEKEKIESGELISGSLTLNIVHAQDICAQNNAKPENYLCKVHLPNQLKPKLLQTEAQKTVNPVWNRAGFKKPKLGGLVSVDVKLTKAEYKEIRCEIYSSGWFSDSYISYVDVNWKKCIEESGQWSVNQIFCMTGHPKIIKKFPGSKFGKIYVQAKFVKTGKESNQVSEPPALLQDLAAELEVIRQEEEKVIEGFMVFQIVHGRALYPEDGTTSDPYCKGFLPDGKSFKQTSTVNKVVDVAWKERYQVAFNVKNKDKKDMTFIVMDHDTFGDDLIGMTEIPIESILAEPGKWTVDDTFQLINKKVKNVANFGEIYLQIMYVKDLADWDKKYPVLKEDLGAEIEKRKEQAEEKVAGKFIVYIVHAKGIPVGDTDTNSSDPFTKVFFPQNKKKGVTKVIKATVNPIWKEMISFEVKMKKQEVDRMKFEIYDKDGMMSSDDLLAFVHVSQKRILECIEQPGSFAINEQFDCKKPDGSSVAVGQLYLQIMFQTMAQVSNGAIIKPVEFKGTENDLEAELQKDQLKGDFIFSIKSATRVPQMDNSFLMGKKADPFCRIFLSKSVTGQEQFQYQKKKPNNYETKVQKNNLEPVWNEEAIMKWDSTKTLSKGLQLCIDCFDQDRGKADELIGRFKFDLDGIFDGEKVLKGEQELLNNLYEKDFVRGIIMYELKFVPQ